MTFALVLLLSVAAILLVSAVRSAVHDGPNPLGPPASRRRDPQFGPPARLR